MNLRVWIDTALPQIQGWCSTFKAHHLASMVIARWSSCSVEIGVWHGRSAIPMALGHKFINHGKLIAIDPWRANASLIGQNAVDQAFWGNQQMHDEAYNWFLHHVLKSQVSDFVDIVRNTSDDADPPKRIGLLHIDGNHSEQAVKDVKKWAPLVDRGGFLVMDDLDWSNGGPRNAMEHAYELGFKPLCILQNGRTDQEKDNYAVLQKL